MKQRYAPQIQTVHILSYRAVSYNSEAQGLHSGCIRFKSL